MEDDADEHEQDDADMEEATDVPESSKAVRGRLLRRLKGTEEYTGIKMIRVQHRRNLVAIMRQGMLTSDYETAAGAIGMLLTCMPEGAHMNRYLELIPGGLELRDSVLEMAWNMLEVMRQYEVTHEQFKRYLNKVTSLLRLEHTMRQVGKLEIIMTHWTKDRAELRTCLDLIRDELGRKHLQAVTLQSAKNFTFHLSAFQAYIRHSIWMEQMLSSTAALPNSQYSSQTSTYSNTTNTTSPDPHSEISQALLGPLQLGPFEPRDDIVTLLQSEGSQQATQQTQGFIQATPGFSQPPSVPMTQQSQAQGPDQPSQGATQGGVSLGDGDLEPLKRSLRRALEMTPAALLPALLLCHTCVITDQQEEAATVARSAVNASGRSPEALSLLAIVNEPAALQPAESHHSRLLEHDSGDAPAAAAAGGDLEGTTSTAELTVTDQQDERSIHEFVELCLEILESDPWQLGAVQGLAQMCAHCQHCAAAAVRGFLAHLDAAGLDATAAAVATGAGDTEVGTHKADTAAATLWSVLSVLLVQLATAVAADAAKQAAAAAAPQAAAAAAVASYQHRPMDVDTPQHAVAAATAGHSAVNAAAHSDANAIAGDTAVQLIWEDLQACFAERRGWWLAPGSVADITELQVLWPQQQQELQEDSGDDAGEEQQQRHGEEHSADAGDGGDGTAQQTEQQQQQLQLSGQQPRQSQPEELMLLRGSESDTDPDEEGAIPQQHQNHMPDMFAAPAGAAADQAARQADSVHVEGRNAGLQAEVSSLWSDTQQTLCCKAIALVFVLGSQNAFSREAADALEATAAAAAGGSDGSSDEDQDPGSLSIASARVALQDAFQLCQQTDHWLDLRRQQRLQELVNQQLQQQAATRRLLGTPSQMFGGMLDMPDSWWACFPQKRRRCQQQQQHRQS